MESSSKILIQMIKRKKLVDKANGALISSIKELMSKQWRVEITYTYQKGNTYTDWLANFVTSLNQGISYFLDPPIELLSLICRDIREVSFPPDCIAWLGFYASI